MELDVIAVGFAGYVVSLWVFIWLSRRRKRRRSGPPPLPKTPVLAVPSAAVTRPRAELFDWIAERDDWVVLSLKPTGETVKSEIIEIAVIDAYGRTLMEQLVRPKRRIPRKAIKLLGIDRKALKGSPKWPEVAKKISALLEDRPVISYNADLNLHLLRQSSARWGSAPLKVDADCAMLAYVAYRDEPDTGRGEPWHKLEKACADEGIEVSQNHRALSDAHMVRDLIVEIASRKRLAQAA